MSRKQLTQRMPVQMSKLQVPSSVKNYALTKEPTEVQRQAAISMNNKFRITFKNFIYAEAWGNSDTNLQMLLQETLRKNVINRELSEYLECWRQS